MRPSQLIYHPRMKTGKIQPPLTLATLATLTLATPASPKCLTKFARVRRWRGRGSPHNSVWYKPYYLVCIYQPQYTPAPSQVGGLLGPRLAGLVYMVTMPLLLAVCPVLVPIMLWVKVIRLFSSN